jgi:hypothetical protein
MPRRFVVYHHTPPKNIPNILRKGLRCPPEVVARLGFAKDTLQKAHALMESERPKGMPVYSKAVFFAPIPLPFVGAGRRVMKTDIIEAHVDGKSVVADLRHFVNLLRTIQSGGDARRAKQQARQYWKSAMRIADFHRHYEKSGFDSQVWLRRKGAPKTLPSEIFPEILVEEGLTPQFLKRKLFIFQVEAVPGVPGTYTSKIIYEEGK